MKWLNRLIFKLKKQKVRVITCGGCMAQDESEYKEGVIISTVNLLIYGSSKPVKFYNIKMNDGKEELHPFNDFYYDEKLKILARRR